MITTILTLAIGTLVGWVFPQPEVAKPVTAKIVELLKAGYDTVKTKLTAKLSVKTDETPKV